ncbi:hypothetical protein JOS77_08580 [Chromobacterium haemolyticum]|nr:hypothetical protein JOS77_08580 [Chromobacterium haemolyticum]
MHAALIAARKPCRADANTGKASEKPTRAKQGFTARSKQHQQGRARHFGQMRNASVRAYAGFGTTQNITQLRQAQRACHNKVIRPHFYGRQQMLLPWPA